MPAKDYRTLGEDLINVAVRLPTSVLEQVDNHIATLRVLSPWARVGRSEALRDLVLRGLQSLSNPQPAQATTVTPDTTRTTPQTGEPRTALKQVEQPSPPRQSAQRELTPAQHAIVLDLLANGNHPSTPKEVQDSMGLKTAPRLRDMAESGILVRVGPAKFTVAPAYAHMAEQDTGE